MRQLTVGVLALAFAVTAVVIWRSKTQSDAEVDTHQASHSNDNTSDKPSIVEATIGDGTWHIVAEDHEQAGDVELAATYDVKRVLLILTGERTDVRQFERTFMLNGHSVQSRTALHVPALARMPEAWFPSPIRDLFGCIVSYDGQDHLVLPRALVDLYGRALSMFNEHPGSLEKLERFIENYNLGLLGESLIVAAFNGNEHPAEHLRAFQDRVLNDYPRIEVPSLLSARIDGGQLCTVAPAWRGREPEERAELYLCYRQGWWRVAF